MERGQSELVDANALTTYQDDRGDQVRVVRAGGVLRRLKAEPSRAALKGIQEGVASAHGDVGQQQPAVRSPTHADGGRADLEQAVGRAELVDPDHRQGTDSCRSEGPLALGAPSLRWLFGVRWAGDWGQGSEVLFGCLRLQRRVTSHQ